MRHTSNSAARRYHPLNAARMPTVCGVLLCLLAAKAAGEITPVTPNASAEATAVLRYLYAIKGKHILSGQQENNNQPKMDLDKLEEITGKAPAVFGQDMGWGTSNDKWRAVLVTKAKEHWDLYKGINTISWHTCPPISEWADDDCGWQDLNEGQPESLVDAVLRPGSTENKIWTGKIDDMAEYLKQLRDAGVPVLWRPYHELNGGWFWWGKQPRLKELWIQLYERLTNLHQLNNLIWVYSPNCEMSYTDSFEEYYPGDEYVDMLGMDIYENYGHTYSQSHYDNLKRLAGDRPIAICENGTIPDVATLAEDQPDWVYFLTWSGFLKGQESKVASVYSHERVLTADEIRFDVTRASSPVKQGTAKTPAGRRRLRLDRRHAGIAVPTGKGAPDMMVDIRGRGVRSTPHR